MPCAIHCACATKSVTTVVCGGTRPPARRLVGARGAVEGGGQALAQVIDGERLGAAPDDLRRHAARGLVMARTIRGGKDQDATHRHILPLPARGEWRLFRRRTID